MTGADTDAAAVRPAARSGAAVLEARDLRILYSRRGGAEPAVRGAAFAVGRGESLALVGESGSGKSSIARAVLGLLGRRAEVSGSLRLDGSDLLALPEKQARRLRARAIAYVPQDPGGSLDPLRRVMDQVLEPLRLQRVGDPRSHRERALQALADAGIEDPRGLAQRWPHELSGGQRQRVLIAAAIASDPALIIADEPTSALDVTVQRRILDRLQELTASQGTSLLLITHDLGVAADRTDRTLVMHGGEIVDEGPSRTLLTSPEHPRTRALVEAIPGRSRALAALAPAPSVADGTALVEAIGVAKTYGTRRERIRALLPTDLVVRPGDSIGIAGASGSGKTTLARILLGLVRSDPGDGDLALPYGGAGTVRVGGRPMAPGGRGRSDREQRRLVQPVFQNPHSSFDPARTIGWSVLEPVRALAPVSRSARSARLAELFADVGLDPALASRRPDELSGGQLQRAAIARALSVSPHVLVCDEAVSALDVTVQAQILALLARLQREHGLALVFITHDLAVLGELCRDVLVMHGGEVVEAGRTADVFAAPRHPRTRELLEAIPGGGRG